MPKQFDDNVGGDGAVRRGGKLAEEARSRAKRQRDETEAKKDATKDGDGSALRSG